jgi:hypothetical protein
MVSGIEIDACALRGSSIKIDSNDGTIAKKNVQSTHIHAYHDVIMVLQHLLSN